ncbi:hypothetical protein L208DRAFT_1403625 [Tricholoma matsutake]|nr:hypothetical protein L208DRAFT_1403625 [Tricholoma matsutake 945]
MMVGPTPGTVPQQFTWVMSSKSLSRCLMRQRCKLVPVTYDFMHNAVLSRFIIREEKR